VPLPSPPNVCKHHQKSGCTLSLKKKLSKYLLKLYRSYSLTTIQQNKKISLNNVKTSNQKCWVAISFSGDLPNPGIKAMLLLSPALAGGFFAASASHFDIKNKIHNYKALKNCMLFLSGQKPFPTPLFFLSLKDNCFS